MEYQFHLRARDFAGIEGPVPTFTNWRQMIASSYQRGVAMRVGEWLEIAKLLSHEVRELRTKVRQQDKTICDLEYQISKYRECLETCLKQL
jgi:hypothetical protein